MSSADTGMVACNILAAIVKAGLPEDHSDLVMQLLQQTWRLSWASKLHLHEPHQQQLSEDAAGNPAQTSDSEEEDHPPEPDLEPLSLSDAAVFSETVPFLPAFHL